MIQTHQNLNQIQNQIQNQTQTQKQIKKIFEYQKQIFTLESSLKSLRKSNQSGIDIYFTILDLKKKITLLKKQFTSVF